MDKHRLRFSCHCFLPSANWIFLFPCVVSMWPQRPADRLLCPSFVPAVLLCLQFGALRNPSCTPHQSWAGRLQETSLQFLTCRDSHLVTNHLYWGNTDKPVGPTVCKVSSPRVGQQLVSAMWSCGGWCRGSHSRVFSFSFGL